MKKLLLTGASGFLGWNICTEGKEQWYITGTSHKNDIAIDGVEMVNIDLTDHNQLLQLFQSVQPDAVIHTAACSDAQYCQQHPDETRLINVKAAVDLAALCALANIPFVFTSSDLVFDGTKGNYTETDAVRPLSVYGAQKLHAETEILKVYEGATICRMPVMFGEASPSSKSFLQQYLEKMRTGEPVQLFNDEYRSVLGAKSAARGLLLAAEQLKGTYHMGGKERLSRLEFGLMVQEEFNLPDAVIHSMSQKEVTLAAPRPADVSMNSSKAYSLGFEPIPVRTELKELVGKL